jgi:hypothetical protein
LSDAAAEAIRRGIAPDACFFCGYVLTGLAEGHVCPECGKRSIPEDVRRETQGIFDNIWKLYAVNLRCFRRYPYGWWWSLDRPGDGPRGRKLLLLNLCLTLFLLGFGIAISGMIQKRTVLIQEYVDPGDPSAPAIQYSRHILRYGLLMTQRYDEKQVWSSDDPIPSGYKFRASETHTRVLNTDIIAPVAAAVALLFPIFVYALLQYAGFCSQLTRSLSRIGRARFSVVNAAHAASCKLPYMALLTWPWLVLEVIFRFSAKSMSQYLWYERYTQLAMLAMIGLFVVPWIGLIRSDPTRTLVLGQRHAVRVFVMYALGFPALLTASLTFAAAMFFPS